MRSLPVTTQVQLWRPEWEVMAVEALACFRVGVHFEGSADVGRIIIVIVAAVKADQHLESLVRESPPREAQAKRVPLGGQPPMTISGRGRAGSWAQAARNGWQAQGGSSGPSCQVSSPTLWFAHSRQGSTADSSGEAGPYSRWPTSPPKPS